MASKRRNSACIFCYKTVKSLPKNAVQNVNQLLQFFSRNHFKISPDSDPPALGDNLSVPEEELVSCDKCFQLGESFSELYSQFENLKGLLKLKIKNILDTMSYAEKVPLRFKKFQSQFDNVDVHDDEVFSHIQKLREDLIKSCNKELKLGSSQRQSFPKKRNFERKSFENKNDAKKIKKEIKIEVVDEEEGPEYKNETKNRNITPNDEKPARKSLRSLFKCTQCQNTFPTYERLKIHMKFHEEFEIGQDKETPPQNPKEKGDPEGVYGEEPEENNEMEEEFDIISDQQAVAALKAMITDEVVDVEKPTFECRTCSQFFPTQGKLRLHNFHKHMRSRILKKRHQLTKKLPQKIPIQPEIQSPPKFQGIWSCPSCPAEFSEPEKFVLHEIKDHRQNPETKTEKPFQCTRCSCSFKWKRNIIKHFLQTHLKIKPTIYQKKTTIEASATISKNPEEIPETEQNPLEIFTCSICQTSFRNRSLLTTHMNLLHHHKVICECQLCPKKLRNQESFKMHMAYQHGKVFHNTIQLLKEENVKLYYIPEEEAISLNTEVPKTFKTTEINLPPIEKPSPSLPSSAASRSSSSLLLSTSSHSKTENLKILKTPPISIPRPIPIPNLKPVMPKPKPAPAFKCGTCSIIYNAPNKFFYHMLQAHGKVFKIRKTGISSQDELENQYVCPETKCSFRCSSKRQLLEHIKEHTDSLKGAQIKVEPPPERTPIKMELTDGKDEASTSTFSLGNLAVEVIPLNNLEPDDCNLEYASPDAPTISETFSLVDFLPALPTSQTASASSSSLSSLKSLELTSTKVPKEKKELLNLELKLGPLENMNFFYSCSFCPFKTGDLGELDKHREVSHLKSESKETSEKKTSSNQQDDYEMEMWKKFKCEVEGCNKFFENSKQLSDHQKRMHSDDRPFHCSWKGCSLKFAIKQDFQRHCKTHFAEKTFQCLFCGRGFARVDNFNRHMKIHE